MKKFLFLLILPVAAFAQEPKEFKLKGELKLKKPVEMVYFYYNDGEQRRVDSLPYTGGEFKLEGKIMEPTMATMVVKYATKQEDGRPERESQVIFLEPTKIEVVSGESLSVLSVTGSGSHTEYVKLSGMMKPFNDQLNKLYEEYSRQAKVNDQAAMEKIVVSVRETQKEMSEQVYKTFIQAHPNSPVALYAIKEYAGYDIDAAKVEPIYKLLSDEIKQYPSAVKFKQQIDIAKKTAVGQPAMDFTQNDPEGKPVSLSSFKGKYVLVDFWASWCGPCRRENPNVVKAYQSFKDKNFTVLGVSLDRPDGKDKWLAAIEKDNLTWTQVSDLKYFENEVAQQYGIQAIPQNLLVDPNGVIVAKNLRGEELIKKLEELIK